MKLDEVQCGQVSHIDLVPSAGADFGAAFPLRAEATLHFSDDLGSAVLHVGDRALPVEGRDARAKASLVRLRDRNLPRLGWVVQVEPRSGNTTAVLVQVHEFPSQQRWPDNVDIGVDEKVVEYVRQKQSRIRSTAEVVTWLSDRFVLPASGDPPFERVLLSGSPNTTTDSKAAFRLHGHGYSIDVLRGSGDKLRITRVVERRSTSSLDEQRPVLLIHGHFRFCDATIAGAFRGAARNQLDRLVEKAGSYLGMWKDYNGLERESVLRRARAFGWLRYSACESTEVGKWRFRLEEGKNTEVAFDILRTNEDIELEAAKALPPELQGGEAPDTLDPGGEGGQGRVFVGAYVHGDAGKRYIDIQLSMGDEEREPPPRGVLFVSISGDRTRLARREHAQARIASAECAMPHLGLLLEGVAVPERRRKTEDPLSAAARELFGGEPTNRQIEALRVALNTPDIALIQGPPGTGKTRTIAALEARLAEISERDERTGTTLLTSYQHDAVENAASRTVVFGLPAIKVGRRRGEQEDKDGFDRWRRERADAVRADLAMLPARPVSEALRQVRSMAANYIASPLSADESQRLLNDVTDLAGPFVSPTLKDRLLALARELQRPTSPLEGAEADDRALALKAVRSLRVEPVSFEDDGPRNALLLRRRLELLGIRDEAPMRLLQQAGEWDGGGTPPFLNDLAQLKRDLLDKLSTERLAGAPGVHADLESLLTEVVGALYRAARESAGGEDAVLYEYLDDLDNDAESVRAAVRDYTVVLAATCQQSVGFQMSRLKGEDTEFENVIVDEAARANPLDLFIPLSRAGRRVILVGDHRQLPHILEPDIEAQLDKSVSVATGIALKRSLFEKLFLEMQERQKKDGVKRTVTLDRQYRMHRVLGDFVSSTFYEPYGEGFKSGRPDTDFEHDLSRYAGRVAAWVDMPLAAGREVGGRSKRRPAEARWIAEEVQRLATERPDFSFGVISFYAAQVDEILGAMVHSGLSERLDDGSFRVANAWRETRGPDGHLKERLRVGTVDRFQGKEFDVVILSMTRSNDFRCNDELGCRQKYGHLLLENRLCVSMSRQQRLLIVVGDALMLRPPPAEKALRGLVAFHKLCGGKHGVLLSP